MIVESTNVQNTTNALLLQNPCCVQYGDCLTHLSNMADNEVSYTITSPPYNVGTVKGKSKYQNTKDNYTQDEYFEWSKNVITELLRVTENEVFYNIQMLTNNKVALMKILGHFAEQVKEVIIWDKKNGEPAIEKGVMNSVFEFIIVFSKNNAHKRKFYNAIF
jgi:DNA modification methylase